MSVVERLAEKREARHRPQFRRKHLGEYEARWWLNAIADELPSGPAFRVVRDWLRAQAKEES